MHKDFGGIGFTHTTIRKKITEKIVLKNLSDQIFRNKYTGIMLCTLVSWVDFSFGCDYIG
jgi:hypothetical protein